MNRLLAAALLAVAACSGSAASTDLTTSAGPLDFGKVGCGQLGTKQTVTLTNTGKSDLHFSAVLAKGDSSAFTAIPREGVVPAGGTATVDVNVTTPSNATLPSTLEDTVQVSTSDVENDTARTIAVKAEATGAVLVFTEDKLQFGTTTVGDSAEKAFHLKNTGDQDVTVTFDVSNSNAGYAMKTPAAAAETTIAKGGTFEGAVTFSPTAVGDAPSANVLTNGTTTSVVCGAGLPSLPLEGTGK